MSEQEAKADEYLKKAEKKLKSWGILGNKYEEAQDLLEKAANNYKLAKQWDKAGECYIKLTDVFMKLESKHEAAGAYVDAANAFKKTSPIRANECLDKAVALFTEIGRLSLAAKHLKDIAELYEKEDDIESAMTFYEKAADFYAGEEVNSTSNQCKLKVAQFAAQLEQYRKAIEIYEQVAQASMDNNLLKYSVKGYLLNAGLCHLAGGDDVAIRNALDKYQDMDPSFSGTRECKLLQDLADALEEGDVTKFTQTVYDFDNMTRLDPWKTKLLLRAKEKVTAKETEEDELT